jgi:hypothetical protein
MGVVAPPGVELTDTTRRATALIIPMRNMISNIMKKAVCKKAKISNTRRSMMRKAASLRSLLGHVSPASRLKTM